MAIVYGRTLRRRKSERKWAEVTHKLESAPPDGNVIKQGRRHSSGSVTCTMSTRCCVRLC